MNLRNVQERSSRIFAERQEPQPQELRPQVAPTERPVLRHMIRPLTILERYANNPGAKLTCKICGEKHARYFCVSCSKVEQNYIVALCGSRGDNDCQAWHCQLY